MMRRHLPFSKGFTPMLHKLSVGTADACSRSPNLTPCSENLDSTYGVRTPRPDFPARAATFGLLEHSDSKVYATLGFTLIEVMVALFIMAGLSVLTAQAIKSGIFNRNKFQEAIARESQVRDAMAVIERDINTAFHYRDLNSEMLKEIAQEKQGGAAAQPPGGAVVSAGVSAQPTSTPPPQLTAFVGTNDSLYFTALSHVRTAKDSLESDQAKIGYYLKTCHSLKNKSASSNCLWRRVATTLDDDVTKGGAEIVVLENVQSLKFRYLGGDKAALGEFVDTWKSNGGAGRSGGGDPTIKDEFPLAVEVAITVQDKNLATDKPVSMTMLAPIRFPNNAPKKDDPKTTTTTGGTPPAGLGK